MTAAKSSAHRGSCLQMFCTSRPTRVVGNKVGIPCSSHDIWLDERGRSLGYSPLTPSAARLLRGSPAKRTRLLSDIHSDISSQPSPPHNMRRSQHSEPGTRCTSLPRCFLLDFPTDAQRHTGHVRPEPSSTSADPPLRYRSPRELGTPRRISKFANWCLPHNTYPCGIFLPVRRT